MMKARFGSAATGLLVAAVFATAGWPLSAAAQERMVLGEEFTATT